MPLAAYGGSGMEDELDTSHVAEPIPAQPPEVAGPLVNRVVHGDAIPTGGPVGKPAVADPAGAGVAEAAHNADELPIPEDEVVAGPSPFARVVHLFRTSRVAAGAGFLAVIVVGLILLSGGGTSPAATAATPTKGPIGVPTFSAPSGEASMTLSGAVAGTFALTGLAGGQHVDARSVDLGWGDALQTTLSITGPLDRGTRTTDSRLVLQIGVLVNGQAVTFTSTAGECTIGMAAVVGKVQGTITCRKLKSADGKLTIQASGTYRT